MQPDHLFVTFLKWEKRKLNEIESLLKKIHGDKVWYVGQKCRNKYDPDIDTLTKADLLYYL